MSLVHVHLMLNHFPVFGTVFALLLLLAGMLTKSTILRNSALAAFAVVALITLPVYFTGRAAGPVAESLSGVAGSDIERHQASAIISLIAVEVLGLAAIAALVLLDRIPAVARRVETFCLLLSVLTGGSLAWTSNLGGHIRHPEVRSETPTSAQESGAR